MKKLLIALLTVASISGLMCKNQNSIGEEDASELVKNYLSAKPEYERTSFRFGEIKFRGKQTFDELQKYRDLESKGLITLDLKESKKIFLFKDSVNTYVVTLTKLAAPLILSQSKDRAVVKAAIYQVDDSKPSNFVKTGDKSAKATISLIKEPTDFYPFLKKTSNTDFITKTYKLKLKKEDGWVVTGD